MRRLLVILSLGLAACEVGTLPDLTGGGSADGGTGTACVNVVTADIPDGHHNPGMGCLSAAGCHNQALGMGVGAPSFAYGGTLFKMDKTTPYAGATVIITLGTAAKQVTVANNGNFWLVAGVAGLDAPTASTRASTKATACPTITSMSNTLGAGDGNCNKSGCHTPGAGQGSIFLQ